MTRKKTMAKQPAGGQSSRGSPVASSVDAFLDDVRTKPIHGLCTSCRHPKRAQVEADCRRYAERKAAGETSIPFRTFVLRWIEPQYGLSIRGDGLLTHMERCCGVKVS